MTSWFPFGRPSSVMVTLNVAVGEGLHYGDFRRIQNNDRWLVDQHRDLHVGSRRVE